MPPDPRLERLEALRGPNKDLKLSPNVRALARFAANHACPTANLAFAARVDLDKALKGTQHEAPFGQSPFALQRGNPFEDGLRHNNYATLRQVLQDTIHYTNTAAVTNLRAQHRNMETRAAKTDEALTQILNGAPGAPALLDGAVFAKDIGGVKAHFEADAVAACQDGRIYVGEVKSFPLVDSQADPEKLSAAVAQAAIYTLLMRETVERLQPGRGDVVSTEALIILPKNVGLQPVATTKDLDRELKRAQRILDAAPRAADLADSLSPDLPTFALVADAQREERERLDAMERILDDVTHVFRPSCLSTCGLSKLCRARAAARGDLARFGGALERLVPGVGGLERLGELAAGADPAHDETPAAARLLEAAELLNAVTRVHI